MLIMNQKITLTIIIIFLFGNVFGQTPRLRLSANSGMFISEIGDDEINHPFVGLLSDPNSTDFISDIGTGFEAELMLPLTLNFETGLEFEFSKLSGSNDVPPYYNLYFSDDQPTGHDGSPAIISIIDPKVFESTVLSVSTNLRYYLMPGGNLNPFLKAFGGVSFVGTQFSYEDQVLNDELITGFLYETESRKTAFHYGGGAGINFKMLDKVSIYIDGTVLVINSDIVNGIPNYDYIESDQSLVPVGNQSLIYQLSLGVVFDSGIDLGFNQNMKKKGRGNNAKGTGRASGHRPFYRKK